MSRLRKRFLDCQGMTIKEAEAFAEGLARQQRDVMFQIGDLYRYAEARWPDTHFQIWPEWISPGMLARAGGVCKAYPKEDHRQAEATYTIYMRNANRPDRLQWIQAHVDAGRTSDEAREADQKERADSSRSRWLIAFDVHYYLHSWYYAGAKVAAADGVCEWITRLVERLRGMGATDVMCAFEGRGSFRKALTEGAEWDGHRYKDREPKESDLLHQLKIVRELLESRGFCCHSVDEYEADDVLASAAARFPGKCTIVSIDKDLRQCLAGGRCNILLHAGWAEDQFSGDRLPDYKWVDAKSHTEGTGLTDENGQYIPGSGITPEQWADFQSIMGDNTDNIQGATGIGEKGAAKLIRQYGSAEAAIQAAKDNDSQLREIGITQKKQDALIELETRLDVTRQLVTLKTDLPIPESTRI